MGEGLVDGGIELLCCGGGCGVIETFDEAQT